MININITNGTATVPTGVADGEYELVKVAEPKEPTPQEILNKVQFGVTDAAYAHGYWSSPLSSNTDCVRALAQLRAVAEHFGGAVNGIAEERDGVVHYADRWLDSVAPFSGFMTRFVFPQSPENAHKFVDYCNRYGLLERAYPQTRKGEAR